MLSRSRCIVRIAAVVLLAAPLLAQQATDPNVPPLRVEKQGSFFVGGHDVHSDTLSSTAARVPSGTITVDQVYVRYQIPVGAIGRPLTLIHGCCLTGKTWETTPDGRMGWDEYFVRKGPRRLRDRPGVARALRREPFGDQQRETGQGRARSTAAGRLRLARRSVGGLQVRTGIPEGLSRPAVSARGRGGVMEATGAGLDRGASDAQSDRAGVVGARAALNGTVLVSHSQSGIYPFQTAALSTAGIAGIVAIEPGACPAADRRHATYVNMPILVLFGDYVDCRPAGRRGSRCAGRSCRRRSRLGRAPSSSCCPSRVPRQFAHADAGQEQPGRSPTGCSRGSTGKLRSTDSGRGTLTGACESIPTASSRTPARALSPAVLSESSAPSPESRVPLFDEVSADVPRAVALVDSGHGFEGSRFLSKGGVELKDDVIAIGSTGSVFVAVAVFTVRILSAPNVARAFCTAACQFSDVMARRKSVADVSQLAAYCAVSTSESHVSTDVCAARVPDSWARMTPDPTDRKQSDHCDESRRLRHFRHHQSL